MKYVCYTCSNTISRKRYKHETHTTRLTTVVELDLQENQTVSAGDTNPTLDNPNLETGLDPQDFNYTEIDSNGDVYYYQTPTHQESKGAKTLLARLFNKTRKG